MNDKERRIKYLERKYSETNVGIGEELFTPTIKRINKNYYSNQKRRFVDGILNEVKNRNSIKEEVHQICMSFDFNEICRTCKNEEIVAVIILYVLKTRNTRYHVERTGLWNRYELTWKKYSLILLRLLEHTRRNCVVVE